MTGDLLVCIIFILQIENQRLFTVTILIEKLVRVIEKNVFSINLTGCHCSGLMLFIAGQNQLMHLHTLQFFQVGGVKEHFRFLLAHLLFSLEHCQPLCHGLAEGSRILKRKATPHQRFTAAHPGTCSCTCSTMPLIHQHQIISLKGFYSDSLVPRIIAQFIDINNLYCAS